MINQVLHGDCLEILKDIPDNSVDLICTDPPYFKVKKDWWDRQWDKPEGFLSWLDSVAEQWQRVLKPNGSLYCFASPKMSARVEVKLGERFNICNRITWAKPCPFSEINKGASNSGRIGKDSLRTYYPNTESIIFCEHYGSDNIAKGEAGYGAKCDELRGFIFEPLRAYLDGERKKLGLSSTPFDSLLGTNALCKKYFNVCQWSLPTEEAYTTFQKAFKGYFLREYEDLRREYEDLRRPFAVTADVPYTDVWTFPTVSHYPGKHNCEKPLPLLEHIIQSSSRPCAVVLDSFAGSGSTLLAAKKLGRNYIGIEIDRHWVDQANQRLGSFQHEPSLEDRIQWLETQVKAQGNKIKKIENQQLSLFSDLA